MIGCVERTDQGGVPWAVPVEFQAEPDPDMPGRLLVYEGLLWFTAKPHDLPGYCFQFVAVVVNLTGAARASGRWRGGVTRLSMIGPEEWNLADVSADLTLNAIAAGTAPRVLFSLIPLMKRGEKTLPSSVERTRRVGNRSGMASRLRPGQAVR